MIGAPTFLQEMLAHPRLAEHDLSSLRLFSCGGASVAPELMRLGRARIPGAVTKRSMARRSSRPSRPPASTDALARGHDTEGRAAAGGRDPHRPTRPDTRSRPATEGEIRARGPELLPRLRRRALDADSFDGDGFFRTGDLGVLDADGYLRVTGRVKDIIVRKGEKISAREVEDLLLAAPRRSPRSPSSPLADADHRRARLRLHPARTPARRRSALDGAARVLARARPDAAEAARAARAGERLPAHPERQDQQAAAARERRATRASRRTDDPSPTQRDERKTPPCPHPSCSTARSRSSPEAAPASAAPARWRWRAPARASRSPT